MGLQVPVSHKGPGNPATGPEWLPIPPSHSGNCANGCAISCAKSLKR